MTITKAVQRIGWRLKGNPFKTNQNDVEAFNFIVNFVKKQQDDQFESNSLFAKLFIYLYTQILKNQEASVFDSLARNKIMEILNKPVNQLIEELQQMMNDSEIYKVLDEAYPKDGIFPNEFRHIHETRIQDYLDISDPRKKLEYALKFQKEKQQHRENVNKTLEQNPEKFTKAEWDLETVETAIIAEVNQMLNIYK